MSKVIVNSVEFEKEIQVFETSLRNIKNIFLNEKKNLQFMNNDEVWKGKTKDTVYNNLSSFQENFEPIEEALEVFINFMKKSLDDYKRFEQTQSKNLEENSYNLNVNS